jgi:hypothetical protein
MYLRRRIVAGAVITLVIVLIWAAVSLTSGTSTKNAVPKPTTTTTTLPPTTTTTIDPGALPQTDVEPPTDTASLMARLQPLWSAIQTNSLTTGEEVFFPESAYLQMKTGVLPDPASDYQSRLIAFFNLDLAAYNQALGAQPTKAVLDAVNANPSIASWIPPGSCENKIGYWHLPNIRMVYTVNGQQESFAVASLISWRGVWYVVHLGPNPRPSNVGTVDMPASGPGTPGPPGGC